MLRRRVLIHIAGDTQRRELADLLGARDRPAEDHHRRAKLIDLTERSYETDTMSLWQTQVEYQQVDSWSLGSHPRNQLRAAGCRGGAVSSRLECRFEPIAHERRVVGHQDGFRGRRCYAGHRRLYRKSRRLTLGFVAGIAHISI